MRANLSCLRIWVDVDFPESVRLARRYGFDSVDPDLAYFATLDGPHEVDAAGLSWGVATLPTPSDDGGFERHLADLRRLAPVASRFGVTDFATYVVPAHADRTYRRNFGVHRERLERLCEALGDDLRLGIEYVGPKPSWSAQRHPFVHSLAEALELVDAVGAPNLGLYLDTYHWHTMGETVDDLLALRGRIITGADLDDGQPGRAPDEQRDLERAMPAETGVIDTAGFLGALRAIGFDGPLSAEPYGEHLCRWDADEAVRRTAESMRAALGR